MAQKSLLWPTTGGGDVSPVSVSDTSAMFAALMGGSGVIKNYLNELVPTVSGSHILMNTGWAIVDGHPYNNSASLDTTITTPAIGTTGHRLVLRADWTAQTVRLIDKASADNTAAIPAVTQTSGTTYEITICTLTITTGGVITMTDARDYAPVSLQGVYGSNTTEATLTSATGTDMVTVSGLSIPAGKPFRIKFQYRKTSGAATAALFGLKINSTVVADCQPNVQNVAATSATNQAEDGVCIVEVFPGETNYQNSLHATYNTHSSTYAGAFSAQGWIVGQTAAMPAATVTSITIRGVSAAGFTCAVKNVYVEAL